MKTARRIVYRVFERNDWTVRQVTNQQAILDEQQLGDAKISFVQSFNDRVALLKVPLDLVINMDETPIYYDPKAKKTFAKKGTKKVSVKKSKTTAKASALLAVSLSGKKLRPMLVYIAISKDGKVKKETEGYDKRISYGVSPKGFSDTAIMLEWVELCLKPYILANGGGPGSGTPSVVMMDNWKAHLTKPTRDAMSALGVVFLQLPPNCTSVVQILDVGVNKPFKNYYERQRDHWLLEYTQQNGIYTAPSVTRKQCAEWSANAWEQVRQLTILKTAAKIGFIEPLSDNNTNC